MQLGLKLLGKYCNIQINKGKKMINDLLNEIIENGDKGNIVPFARIENLKDDLIELKSSKFHTNWLNRMVNWVTDSANKFIPSDINFKPHSLISIVMPSPMVVLQFKYNCLLHNCIIPPHYFKWDYNNNRVLEYLRKYLMPFGFSVEKIITLPQKMLAVHCGLALYGRNNICYNNEFGSYMQIMTYVSDLPCNNDLWFPLKRMEICDQCSICINSCPTNVIEKNRKLINSDRCLTLINESPGEFPEWIDKNFHNSIIGCMKCQENCPGNIQNKNKIKKEIFFTEEETIEFMNHNKGDLYTGSLAKKIEEIGILKEFLEFMPRNLKALII
jgi:epoxyqueuosine reductase